MNFGLTAVSFYISLIDNINAVFIAQIEKNRVGRIVRGAHAVYIIFLKNLNIALHIVNRHNIAGFGVRIVMINALKFDPLIVKGEHIAVDFDMLKTYRSVDNLNQIASLRKSDDKMVCIWNFGAPLLYLEVGELNFINVIFTDINRFGRNKLSFTDNINAKLALVGNFKHGNDRK